LAEAIAEKERRIVKRECEESLAAFIKHAWHVIEPGNGYVHGWHIDAWSEHLEAVIDGRILRLLGNLPPGTMKSLMTSVFFPAWVWGPKGMSHKRFLATSHNERNSTRDTTKCRRLIQSDWYRAHWPDVVLTGDQNAKTKFENTASGFREGVPFTSMTGVRADVVILDDPMSVDDALSVATKENVNLTFRESLPTRLVSPEESAIVVIMQRLAEDDTSGIILSGDYGYEHFCLPMRFESDRRCQTSIGFVDPRTEDGELLFPERFPEWVVKRDERIMGPTATAGQMQQTPQPRGGGIIQRAWWQDWPSDSYPVCEYVLASLDTAYTEKQENDPSALTIWGVFRDGNGNPKVILLYGWEGRLALNDLVVGVASLCSTHEIKAEDLRRIARILGLDQFPRFPVDKLIIEAKASGISAAQELHRLYGGKGLFGVELIDPSKAGDKVARMHSVQHMFADEMVYAPDRSFADMVIDNVSVFPKGVHDDLADSVSQALRYLRLSGLLLRREEHARNVADELAYRPRLRPLY
jgi:predicted phage terminase large subunit-like protein